MKIVLFKDGSYGIRSGFFIYQYLSIYEANHSSAVKWSGDLPIHHFYKGSLEDVRKVFSWLTDCGVPIGKPPNV